MDPNPLLIWSALARDLDFGVIVVDEALRVRYWNKIIDHCSGRKLDQCIDQPLGSFFPETDSPRFRQLIERTRVGQAHAFTRWEEPQLFPSVCANTQGFQNVLTFTFPSDKGQPFYGIVLFDNAGLDSGQEAIESALGSLNNEGSDAFLKNKLEQANIQLLQSEKLAAIGQLAAGVAHEINNPIGYVYSNLQTLNGYVKSLMTIIDGVESTTSMDEIRQLKRNLEYDYIREDIVSLTAESQEGIERVKTIITALKDFSHTEEDEFRLADVHHGLDTTLNVVNNELKYKAEVHKEYGDLPEVECILSQINQVVMNLLINAAHAIEKFGRITLRTGREGDWGWLEVEDTGRGIKPEALNRIYEPFFTTKPLGKGTGLGLSLSFSIVEKHKGRIEVASEVGQGSRFRVWLPLKQPADSTGEVPDHA